MQVNMVGKSKILQFAWYSVTTLCNPLRISYGSKGFKSYIKNIFNTWLSGLRLFFLNNVGLCCHLDFYMEPENRFSYCA